MVGSRLMKRDTRKLPQLKSVEVYGPHLPPGAQLVNGRLVPIPPVARSGAETKAQMDRVNNTPISPACFTVEPWHGRGGSAGLSWNGQLLSGKKPW